MLHVVDIGERQEKLIGERQVATNWGISGLGRETNYLRGNKKKDYVTDIV